MMTGACGYRDDGETRSEQGDERGGHGDGCGDEGIPGVQIGATFSAADPALEAYLIALGSSATYQIE